MKNKNIEVGNIIKCINPKSKFLGFKEGTLAEVIEILDGEYVVNVLSDDFPFGSDGLMVDKTDFEYYAEDFYSAFPEYLEKHKQFCEERRNRERNSASKVYDDVTFTYDEIICPHPDCNAVFYEDDIKKFEKEYGGIGWMPQHIRYITCPCCGKPFYAKCFKEKRKEDYFISRIHND